MKDLLELPIHKTIIQNLENGILIDKTWDLPKSLVLHNIYKNLENDIVVITSGESSSMLLEDLSFFHDDVFLLPAWEVSGKHGEKPSKDVMGERLNILQKLSERKEKKIVFTPLSSFFQKILSELMIYGSMITFETGKYVEFAALEKTLTSLGMVQVPIVNDKGQFAIRGSIIDMYPSSEKEPYRIEFFGDEVESIRTFDPCSQLSTGKIKKITFGISDEFSLLQQDQEKRTLLSIFNNPILVFDEITAIEDKACMLNLIKQLGTLLDKKLPHIFFTKENIMELSCDTRITKKGISAQISFEMFSKKMKKTYLPLPFYNTDHYDFENADALVKEGYRFTLVAEKEKEQEMLFSSLFKDANSKAEIKTGYLSSGLVCEKNKHIIYPYTLLTNKKKVRRSPYRRGFAAPLSEFHELERGDLVVHLHNGIGKYEGIEKKKNHLGEVEEFIEISYAGKSKLFIPLSQSHLITRYIGPNSSSCTLTTLGSNKWATVKAKTQTAITLYAKELLTTQAIREKQGGVQCPPTSALTEEFISYFPYEETSDQKAAVEAIFKDMESKDPMDRLVLGDVGFGKTEVAMRAAFKACADGSKQVALLVPTTILATQHYENFTARMKPFGIEVGLMSRFQKPKELTLVKKQLLEGKIDIVIGTHRIINKDVVFKDLGLMIIDEEQRFGVKAKEALKQRKASVDCLTLSATPIPRTLYMSLVKVKDLSIISTPPMDRLPIQTVLAEFDKDVIAHALKREFLRDGQSFYIHNRVETIAEKANEIQNLLPEATIAVCHGQLPAISIDNVFQKFKKGEVDILIATTIVESGIDIPRANTIVIENAQRFGIADLYQLRGRVGRWNRSAYTYLLLPKNKVLPQESMRRLRALTESSSLGGAYKLAMVDLEIRGCGDILGTKQSGQMETVGFHLYCKMLKQAVEALKDGKAISFIDTEILHPFSANIPSFYIPEVSLRLEIYNRLGGCLNEEEIDKLFGELIDRYGKTPLETKWLFCLAKAKLFAQSFSITKIHVKDVTLTFTTLHMGKKEEKTLLFKPCKAPDTFLKQLKIQLV